MSYAVIDHPLQGIETVFSGKLQGGGAIGDLCSKKKPKP
ncbi:hypothetical protein GMO_11420 [Gluconobacter morbifer G707]|uniref:Uncharacterized protein n=1 Tax=Gluconobacter morbifer G707 TaxID=1088869 RepID=G6XIR4_9PROT|nr:hypothetical protein GMO_11420 [Gluconobacter morbifer G707]